MLYLSSITSVQKMKESFGGTRTCPLLKNYHPTSYDLLLQLFKSNNSKPCFLIAYLATVSEGDIVQPFIILIVNHRHKCCNIRA